MGAKIPTLSPSEAVSMFKLLREEAEARAREELLLTDPDSVPRRPIRFSAAPEVGRMHRDGLVEKREREGHPPFAVTQAGRKSLHATVMTEVLNVIRDLDLTRDKRAALESTVIDRVAEALEVDDEYQAEVEESVRRCLSQWFM